MGRDKDDKESQERKQAQKQAECDAARSTVIGLFEEREATTLRAWLKHFDRNHDMKITFREFCAGMAHIEYKGDAAALFRAIDIDGSGELTLDEIHRDSSLLWTKFRMWCAETYSSPAHFITALTSTGSGDVLVQADFLENVPKASSYTPEQAAVLYRGIDVDDLGCIATQYMKWFELDKKRHKRKQAAKKQCMKDQAKRANERVLIQESLQNFKAFLRTKYCCYLRAWRRGLDLDGSMSVQKHELFKACKEMGWTGDVRLLWKALDSDGSNVTALEEIDASSAVQLARFKEFLVSSFGSASAAFSHLDASNHNKLKEPELRAACKKHGYEKFSRALFQGLDYRGRKFVMEEDLKFLDAWKPPSFLTGRPNEQAANQFKASLIRHYQNYVKAWRRCLDKDNSNVVSWQEFETAAKKLRFNGDIAGVWRYLDDDLSGFISLREIDVEASESLIGFKRWCNEEFGNVRSAFTIFDTDGSGELDFKEFRRACASYAYEGNTKRLFDALDNDQQGLLELNEVSFLDEWEMPEDRVQAEAAPPEPKSVKVDLSSEEVILLPVCSPRVTHLALPRVLGAKRGPVEPYVPPAEWPWTARAARDRLAQKLDKRKFIGC